MGGTCEADLAEGEAAYVAMLLTDACAEAWSCDAHEADPSSETAGITPVAIPIDDDDA